jgi:uncharacterized membrane protein YqjE
MSRPAARRGGLFVSVRRLCATVLELAQVRLELLVVDLEQEKQRVLEALLWAGVALLLMGVGLVLIAGFVVMLFAENHRLAALGVLAALFIGGGALLMHRARLHLKAREGMFGNTLAELAGDGAAVSPRE